MATGSPQSTGWPCSPTSGTVACRTCSSSSATPLLGLPDAVNAVWSDAVVQTCIIHLILNLFWHVSRKCRDELSRDLRPSYSASSDKTALSAPEALKGKWGTPYPAMIRSWRSAWSKFVLFLDFDVEIRTVICLTNAIESLNARYRRAVKAGHEPILS